MENLPQLIVDDSQIDSSDNFHRDYIVAKIAALTISGTPVTEISKILGFGIPYIVSVRNSLEFQQALRQARTYLYDAAVSKLAMDAETAANVILDIMNDTEASSKTRLEAAKTVLTILRQAKQDEISDRLEEIEKTLGV